MNRQHIDREVEVVIIGGGTAGMVAYRQAAKQCENTLLIQSGPFGTTCARVGCMPSKLLIAAAESAHAISRAKAFGTIVDAYHVDSAAVMARVQRERDRFVSSVLDSIEQIPAEKKLKGFAKFIDDHHLSIALEDGGETIIKADRIVIACGSSPSLPEHFAALGERLLTTDSIFELQALPERIAIFGPGVIGVELGQALARLGVDVKMFGIRGGLAGIQDEEIRAYAKRCFSEEFYLDTESDVGQMRLVEDNTRVEINYKADGKDHVTHVDYVLAATGRAPNITGLKLENTCLELDDNGMPQFDRFTMKCGDSHIFIAGDVNNFRPLLHEAADEGRIAGKNAASFPELSTGLRRAPMAIVFTDPQILSVGCTMRELASKPETCYATGQVSFENQGRSRTMLKNKGILKVYGEQGSGLFIGAEMFGPAAEHIAHLLAWALQQRLTVSNMLDMPFYHPVIEEGVRTALRKLSHQLKTGPSVPENCLDCGPGA